MYFRVAVAQTIGKGQKSRNLLLVPVRRHQTDQHVRLDVHLSGALVLVRERAPVVEPADRRLDQQGSTLEPVRGSLDIVKRFPTKHGCFPLDPAFFHNPAAA